MSIAASSLDSVLQIIDPQWLIETFGPLGVLAIIFAETGLLIGFFLPGDSLLFTAGFFTSDATASIARLPLALLLVGAPVFAIAGAQVGHLLGAKAGPKMFARPDSRFFRKEYVDKAEYYFEKFGPAKAVVLARFIPIVRTFLNPVAGVLGMSARQFFIWNVIGGILWTDGILLIGHFLGAALGEAIDIDKYLLPAILVIILLSILPIVREVYVTRKEAKARKDDAPGASANSAYPPADSESQRAHKG
ncbi:MAG: DedA family protein [Streptosporangiales bacterium]|nr:DedA family protein [Streptosporangiales bacterium]